MNADLLRSSFEKVIEREPKITARFYEILFSRYPQVKPLFGKNSARAQQEMLQGSLVAVIDNLENPAWLATNLSALGAKHVDYGVTYEMFAWVGDALLTALAQVLGDDWNEAVSREWETAYGAIRDLMVLGMNDAAKTSARLPTSAESSAAI